MGLPPPWRGFFRVPSPWQGWVTLNVITGFQASNIGQYGIGDLTFAGYSRPFSSAAVVAPEGPFSAPGGGSASPFFTNPVIAALGQIAAAWFDPRTNIQAARLPAVLSGFPGPEASVSVDAGARPPAVVPQAAYIPGTQVIDPGYDTEGTVYEEPIFEEGSEWYSRTGETDWERVYSEYVILNQPEEPEVWDWLQGATTIGQLGTAVGWWDGNNVVAQQPAGMLPAASGAPPARVTVDTRTGKITKCKRRRRRKLLTESDFNVLLRVATLPNKENVRIVLGKAIGRS